MDEVQQEITDPRSTVGYWKRWIRSAKDAAEQHWSDTKSAWSEYEKRAEGDVARDDAAETTPCYPLYWASCKTIEPAYYSRPPKVVTDRRFGIDDEIALTACDIVERLAEHLRETGNFHAVMRKAVGDFIHGDKATTQVIYEAETEDQRIPVAISEDGTTLDATTGQPIDGEVREDEQGLFTIRKVAIPETQRVYLAPALYREVIHTPDAKTEEEIEAKGFFFTKSREEAEERFPGKVITWKRRGKDGKKRTDTTEEVLEGWEVWCKKTEKIYFVSEQCAEFLDVREDTWDLDGFFPSPDFIISSEPSDNLYPTPAFIHLHPMLRQLHLQAHRVFELIDACQRKAIVADDPDLVKALTELKSAEFVTAKNLQGLVEKGGIANMIHFIPVAEFVQALKELVAMEEHFVAKYNEFFGIPDILRGQSDPQQTAAAGNLEAGAAHDRFKTNKQLIAQLARDSLRLMVDLALQLYGDEKIAEIAGLQFMKPEEQQRFPAALALLRNDKQRVIRVDIETDSMSYVDRILRQRQITQATEVVVHGLQTCAQMAKGDPAFIPVGLEVVLTSLDAFDAGREFSDTVKKAVTQLMEQKQQPQQPPPDYEGIKLQLQGQKQQLEAQAKERELQQKEFKLQLEAQKQANETALSQQRAELESVIQQAMVQMEAMRVDIERFRAEVQAREAEMEEVRLAREADARMVEAAMPKPETAKQSPVQVIIDASKQEIVPL